MTGRRGAAAIAAALLLVIGCSDGDGDAGDDAGTATTAAVDGPTTTAAEDGPPTWADLAERGPRGVGSTTLDLGGRRVAVWYPAVEGAGDPEAGPTDTFDLASLLTPELQAQIPAELRVGHPVAATAGAEPDPDGGPYPLVLFSHGFAGFPEQSAHLTTHLASWGFVVAAPDHVERSISGLLGGAAEGVAPATDAEVLGATIDLVLAESDAEAGSAGSPLAGLVDGERVAVVGHSAGAGAAVETAAADDRVDAFASLSLGRGDDAAVPTVPGLVMLGEADSTIPPDRTRAAFAALARPRYLLELAGAGHLVFSDICLIGADQGGLTGIVQSIGLPIPEQFLRLATDGCGAGYPPVTDDFPAVEAVTLAFLRATFDPDDPAAALLVSGPVDAGPGTATLTAEP